MFIFMQIVREWNGESKVWWTPLQLYRRFDQCNNNKNKSIIIISLVQ